MLRVIGMVTMVRESTSTNEPNSYLALRDAKIARNNARLQTLGLLSNSSKRIISPCTVSMSTSKRQKPNASTEIKFPYQGEPVRRSQRLRKEIAMEQKSVDPNAQPITKSSTTMRPLTVEDLKELESLDSVQQVPQRISDGKKNSARDISLNVDRLLFGSPDDDNDDGVLGIQMRETGKAFVIEESARIGAIDYHNTLAKSSISFNKYCGAQEWGNDVIYLWINFGSPCSDVVNTFSADGRQVNWYGGSKMHDQTPMIQRLKRLGIQKASSITSSGAIVLWCRHYNPKTKGFDPYISFGRLSLVSYDPLSHPVQFIWNLIDFDKVKERQSKKIATKESIGSNSSAQ